MTTLTQAFEAFRRSLDPTEAPADGILARNRIREHVMSVWQPGREAVVGSYRRGTNLRPTRELDYLFVLPSQHHHYVQSDPARCLDDLAVRADVAFPRVRTRKVTHGLGLLYGDMTVVLVPATPRHGGGVFIPDTEQRRWLPSDPDAHERWVREVERKVHPLAVTVARAVRHWRRAHAVPVRGFHLEALALRALEGAPVDLAGATRVVFERIVATVKARCPAVGPVGDDLDAYLALRPADRERIALAAADAFDSLCDAVEYEARGEHHAARAAGRTVFGAAFPE